MKKYQTDKLDWNCLESHFLDYSSGTLNLSSGNPVIMGEIVSALQEHYRQAVDSNDFSRLVYRYDDPQGHPRLRHTLAEIYKETYGFPITADNIIITAGSQAAFFYFSEIARRREKKIFFPCGPEYPGYRTHPDALYEMARPGISITGEHEFEYHLLPGALEFPLDTLFVLLASPGNPTGKICSATEIRQLQEACELHDAYLMLDGAYARPVPGITFRDLEIPWSERFIFTTSLSKAGLAGERLGIIIAPIELVSELVALQSKVNILAPLLVQHVVEQMLRSGIYKQLCQEVVEPGYKKRHTIARDALKETLDRDIPYYIYKAGGSPFLWPWFDNLPISTNDLFLHLLEKKVILMPGSVFYLPQLQNWSHAHQCLRVGLIETPANTRKAMEMLGQAINRLYREKKRQA